MHLRTRMLSNLDKRSSEHFGAALEVRLSELSQAWVRVFVLRGIARAIDDEGLARVNRIITIFVGRLLINFGYGRAQAEGLWGGQDGFHIAEGRHVEDRFSLSCRGCSAPLDVGMQLRRVVNVFGTSLPQSLRRHGRSARFGRHC